MSKKTHRQHWQPRQPNPQVAAKVVTSLLDAMVDGQEYGSIVGLTIAPGHDLVEELVRGINEIASIRERPCIVYAGNVVRSTDGNASIDFTDDLPFAEMVQSVPLEQRSVDVFLATLGGSAQQVNRFVGFLRNRFDEVDFLIPSFCMSAGTLFALSGDRIWMTPRAGLGPIDPQVPTSQGRYVPAQALLALLDFLQQQGASAMKNNQPIPWSAIRAIDSLDKKELGDALTASQYSMKMAAEFIRTYKFKHWTVREKTGQPVTDAHKLDRANKIASDLANHDLWKSHGHTISRDVLWQEIRLKVDHPDAALDRAMTRLWALYHWTFDKTPLLKTILSDKYRYIRHSTVAVAP